MFEFRIKFSVRSKIKYFVNIANDFVNTQDEKSFFLNIEQKKSKKKSKLPIQALQVKWTLSRISNQLNPLFNRSFFDNEILVIR